MSASLRYNATAFFRGRPLPAAFVFWTGCQARSSGMIESDAFVQGLQDIGLNFFTGVPDSILGGIIETLMERRLYTPAVREDEALAMAAGAYMAGRAPAVLMQNSGLGTSLNTLISLNLIYQQPCLLLISWRGYQGKDAPEHLVMGQTMIQLLDTMRIPHRIFSEETAVEDLQWVAQTFMKDRIPVALLLKKGIVKGLHP
jgi:sulfopyruvate decarboxylase subunit alpha